MRSRALLRAAAAVLAAVLAPAPARTGEKTVLPSRNLITGLVDGAEAERLRPASGVLTSQEEFDKLWEGWLFEAKAPKVDFKTGVVVVAASREGPIKSAALVDEKKTGDMKVRVELERKTKGTGLHVLIAVFPRAGIKTIDGHALADK